MSEISETQIMDALQQMNDPEIHRNIVDLKMVEDLKIKGGRISFALTLTIHECPLRDHVANAAKQVVQK
jgi:ATP-binding protein involved in chromosome partitioning